MAAQIVHNNDVAGCQCWHQELLDIGIEACPVDRTIEHAGCIDTVMAQCGQEGQRLPMTERRSGHQLVAARCPAPDRRHVRLGPGLVDEHQAARIKPALILLPLRPPARDRRPVLLDGEQRFF